MAPFVDIPTVPSGEPQPVFKEKVPFLTEISPPVNADLLDAASPSASSIEQALGSKFELEDHPIDEGRRLRVWQFP